MHKKVSEWKKGNPGRLAGKGESMPILSGNLIYEETGNTECIERGQKPGVFVIVGCKKELF